MRLSYTAEDETPREWRDVQELSMGLPLTVNVQDVFRPKWSVVSPGQCKPAICRSRDPTDGHMQPPIPLHDCVGREGIPPYSQRDTLERSKHKQCQFAGLCDGKTRYGQSTCSCDMPDPGLTEEDRLS